jgi:hypothetical protein
LQKWGGGKEEWKYNEVGELVQGTLCACMKLSQGNPLILLMYDNANIKLKIN